MTQATGMYIIDRVMRRINEGIAFNGQYDVTQETFDVLLKCYEQVWCLDGFRLIQATSWGSTRE